ncbi:MAG TPA: PilZ domain-containing protein [Terriglobales bacterium]|nr:PilZ domain-containing protein [Terriglobales bacterium]
MALLGEILAIDVWKAAREYPRVRLILPVVVKVGDLTLIGETQNVSLGGLLMKVPYPFTPGLELSLLFNLPTGLTVSTRALVVHTPSKKSCGVRFTGLEGPCRAGLALFVEKLIEYVRRGVRVSKRMHVTLRPTQVGKRVEEMAETVVLSKHGGLLVTRARFNVGGIVYLWWPEGKRGAYVRVVHRREEGAGGLAELGFEFTQAANFWGLNFPDEKMM